MGKISLEVNGIKVEKEALDNTLLSTFLREHMQLTGNKWKNASNAGSV